MPKYQNIYRTLNVSGESCHGQSSRVQNEEREINTQPEIRSPDGGGEFWPLEITYTEETGPDQ